MTVFDFTQLCLSAFIIISVEQCSVVRPRLKNPTGALDAPPTSASTPIIHLNKYSTEGSDEPIASFQH